MVDRINRVHEAIVLRHAEYLDLAIKYESAFGECHPVGFIGVVSALYLGVQNRQNILSTDAVGATFGQRNIENKRVYHWLARGADKVHSLGLETPELIKRCGQDEVFQTWQLTDYSKDLKLPELSMLLTAWMNENYSKVDVHSFLEFEDIGKSKVDTSFIQLLYLTYLYNNADNSELPEDVNNFLVAQSNVFKEIDSNMSRDDRRNMRKSLFTVGLLKRSGEPNKYEYSLTEGGKSFVKDVAIPFSALLIDEDGLRANPMFEKYNRLLMMPIGTYFEDRQNGRLMLEEFGTKVAPRYK